MATETLRLPGRRTRSRLRWNESLWGYLFILPWALGFLLFTAGPMVASFVLSFTQYDIVQAPEFAGLYNYQRLIQDVLIRKSLYNTAYYVLIGVPLNTMLALLAAMLLTRPIRGQNFFRAVFYVPSVVPLVANAILWMWLLNPDFGLFNMALRTVGLPQLNWFHSVTWSKPSFILMSLFTMGTQMVVFIAGIRNIPASLYEAAEIDGANRLRLFWHITIPMLSPVIFFNLIISMIGAFQVFTTAYVVTDGAGGPSNSTLFYVLYLYRNAWLYFKMGYASAMAWLLFLIVIGGTALQFLLARKWVYYEV